MASVGYKYIYIYIYIIIYMALYNTMNAGAYINALVLLASYNYIATLNGMSWLHK